VLCRGILLIPESSGEADLPECRHISLAGLIEKIGIFKNIFPDCFFYALKSII
jgi:hypothetical protein